MGITLFAQILRYHPKEPLGFTESSGKLKIVSASANLNWRLGHALYGQILTYMAIS